MAIGKWKGGKPPGKEVLDEILALSKQAEWEVSMDTGALPPLPVAPYNSDDPLGLVPPPWESNPVPVVQVSPWTVVSTGTVAQPYYYTTASSSSVPFTVTDIQGNTYTAAANYKAPSLTEVIAMLTNENLDQLWWKLQGKKEKDLGTYGKLILAEMERRCTAGLM